MQDQDGNKTMDDPSVKELLVKDMTWSQMWLEFWRQRCPYDKNFLEVSKYASNNSISIKPKEYAKECGITELLEYAQNHTKEEFLKYIEEK